MDQEPEQHIISVVITGLAIIILVLIAVILFIVSKNKRTRTAAVLNALQHTPYSDGIDKRLNSNFKVSMDDNESIDKSSLYHEPFNVNMYTSAASGCTLNDMQQRLHVTPDYTGEQAILPSYYFDLTSEGNDFAAISNGVGLMKLIFFILINIV
jgi:discoidin domain receptor family member 2